MIAVTHLIYQFLEHDWLVRIVLGGLRVGAIDLTQGSCFGEQSLAFLDAGGIEIRRPAAALAAAELLVRLRAQLPDLYPTGAQLRTCNGELKAGVRSGIADLYLQRLPPLKCRQLPIPEVQTNKAGVIFFPEATRQQK